MSASDEVIVYGHATFGARPVLHIYESTKYVSYPWGAWDNVTWRCGATAKNPVLLSEPSGMKPCQACHAEAVPPYDVVYFATDGELVKIGQSRQCEGRVRSLHARLLATIPGDGRTEAAMHRVFAALRVRGEWFRYEDPLASFIATLVADDYTAGRPTPLDDLIARSLREAS